MSWNSDGVTVGQLCGKFGGRAGAARMLCGLATRPVLWVARVLFRLRGVILDKTELKLIRQFLGARY
jgi:hypothetical protein